ncbi:MAG: methyl-accepting chemotaxis protein [Clostridium sp.]|nr:methyl-accepting chemotaxis protein [Clostridium sp.]
MKSLGDSNTGLVGIYMNFDPKFTDGSKAYDVAYDYEDQKKQANISNNSYLLEDYKETNEELSWYFNPVKAKKGIWSKPYIDSASDNINMISYTMPVYANDELVGVAGMDISYESLEKLILSTKISDSGSAFLLANDYTFLVGGKSTNKLNTLENGKYKFITDELSSKKSIVLETTFEGTKQIMGFYTMNNGQILGVKVPSQEVLGNLIYIIILIMIIGIIISVIVGLFIGRRISKQINVATSYIGKLAKLDLTYNDKNLNQMLRSKDEIGIMGNNLVDLRGELIKVVEELKRASYEVLESSNIISANVEETSSKMEIVNESVKQVSLGTEQLSATTQEVNATT